MGLVGSFIDSLPDRAKDRVIRAQDWGVVRDAQGTRFVDLVDHAEGCWPEYGGWARGVDRWSLRLWRHALFGVGSRRRIRDSFVRLVRRKGEQGAARILKLRAARSFTPRGLENEAERW